MSRDLAVLLLSVALLLACSPEKDVNICAEASQHLTSCVAGRKAVENPPCDARAQIEARRLLEMDCTRLVKLASSGKADWGWCWTFWDCTYKGSGGGGSAAACRQQYETCEQQCPKCGSSADPGCSYLTCEISCFNTKSACERQCLDQCEGMEGAARLSCKMDCVSW